MKFTLIPVLVFLPLLAACKPDGHFLGGYADGAHRAATVYHVHVPVYYPPPRLRYYGQPHVDRYDAGRDPWLAENDPWVVQ